MLPRAARRLPVRADHGRSGAGGEPGRVRRLPCRGGYLCGGRLLAHEERPTAVFAGSDLQALGVLEAARVRGLRVPEDLSVVGYDDLEIAKWTSPALTTVRQPLREMAEEATRLLLRPRDDKSPLPTRLELSTTLVVRASTAPPPQG
ncbi:LacI family DNA-binding transcriptional regulator [Streptacidiphilus monticola]